MFSILRCLIAIVFLGITTPFTSAADSVLNRTFLVFLTNSGRTSFDGWFRAAIEDMFEFGE